MSDFERRRCQRPLGTISRGFKAADPIFAGVATPHVAPPRMDEIALDRLAGERFALSGPIVERAGLEAEIQRASLSVGRENPGRPIGPRLRLGLGLGLSLSVRERRRP